MILLVAIALSIMSKPCLTSNYLRQFLSQFQQSQRNALQQKSLTSIRLGLTTLIALLALLATDRAAATAHEGYAGQRFQQQRIRLLQEQPPDQPPEFQPGTPGVCRLYHLSGYMAMNQQGQVVSLSQYCEQQRNWAWYDPDNFWQEFRKVASAETITFAQSLTQARVEAYAQSICPFLEDGGTLQELAQIQTDAQLPADFEQAVTIAAVKTYCRQHRQQIRE
jgi:hypothetical protein